MTLGQMAEQLAGDQTTLERELAEIELLISQARTEAERTDARRVDAEERVRALERDAPSPPELTDARGQLLAHTRRQALMVAQLEVLGGKQRALQRFRDRLAEVLPVVRAAHQPTVPAAAPASAAVDDSATLVNQEQLRRDIARQMHDGPAQSIANIALQAQIVQRLFAGQAGQGQAELLELIRMVEHALETTKDFIFDVRPMVLDDLGLVPTLRRSTLERGRRVGVSVRFESVGADRRLAPELESALFRVVDDVLVGYLSASPWSVTVTLDWEPREVRATVRAATADADQPAARRVQATVDAARRERAMPAALASMIRDQERDDTLRAIGLPEAVWADVAKRAASVGLRARLAPDRSTVEVALATA